MTNKPTIRPLNDIVKVKNASLFFDYETRTYHLVHYDTEILTIKTQIDAYNIDRYTITKALKCSNSSTRAIIQLTEYLGIDRKEIESKMIPYTNFVKYNMSTDVYKTKQQLKEIIEK